MLALLVLLGMGGAVIAQSACGAQVTVSETETITDLALRCGVTVEALVAANPGLDPAAPLQPGQVIQIPALGPPVAEPTPGAPITSPVSGPVTPPVTSPVTTPVTSPVTSPVTQPVTSPVTAPDTTIMPTSTVTTTPEADTTPPAPTASVMVTPEAPGPAGPVIITQTIGAPAGPDTGIYIVQRGDWLSTIARRFGVTLSALLAANPEISNPDRIEVGQQIRIPAEATLSVASDLAQAAGATALLPETAAQETPFVAITPTAGLPGTPVEVIATGFAPNEAISIRIGREAMDDLVVVDANARADSAGNYRAIIAIPASAQVSERWIVAATRRGFQAISNVFTVTAGEPAGQGTPLVRAAPANAAPGSQLQVTGSGFPPNVPLVISLGLAGAESIPVANAVTGADGIFTQVITIPETAQPGQDLVISVTMSDPSASTPDTRLFTALSNNILVE